VGRLFLTIFAGADKSVLRRSAERGSADFLVAGTPVRNYKRKDERWRKKLRSGLFLDVHPVLHAEHACEVESRGIINERSARTR